MTLPDDPMRRAAARQALERAVRLLAMREHGRCELKRKLLQRGLDAGSVRAALDECERLGYIDDRRAAELFARSRARQGFGPRSVRQGLQRRGFDTRLIASVLAPYTGEAAQNAAARSAAQKKLRQLRPDQDPRRRKEKLYRFLAARGFSPRAARQAVLDTSSD